VWVILGCLTCCQPLLPPGLCLSIDTLLLAGVRHNTWQRKALRLLLLLLLDCVTAVLLSAVATVLVDAVTAAIPRLLLLRQCGLWAWQLCLALGFE
jgi:hypothetical protein